MSQTKLPKNVYTESELQPELVITSKLILETVASLGGIPDDPYKRLLGLPVYPLKEKEDGKG